MAVAADFVAERTVDMTKMTGHETSEKVDRRGAMMGAAALGMGGLAAAAFGQEDAASRGGPNRLAVLWTSGDPDVAHRVGLMYTHAAKRFGWFDEVRLVIWGPSQRTLCGDKDLKAKIAEMQSDGVITQACIACARTFGLVDALRELEFEVKPMGKPLSEFLKDPSVAVLTV